MFSAVTSTVFQGHQSHDYWRSARPGKRLQHELERSTMFNGKIHYFYGHFR